MARDNGSVIFGQRPMEHGLHGQRRWWHDLLVGVAMGLLVRPLVEWALVDLVGRWLMWSKASGTRLIVMCASLGGWSRCMVRDLSMETSDEGLQWWLAWKPCDEGAGWRLEMERVGRGLLLPGDRQSQRWRRATKDCTRGIRRWVAMEAGDGAW